MVHPDHAGGQHGRITAATADELVQTGNRDEAAHAEQLAHAMSVADIAHALHMHEQGLLDVEVSSRLVAGLLEIDELPAAHFGRDASVGDAFLAREHELTARVGAAASGWLSAGRPRREVFRVALQLRTRSLLVDLHGVVCDVIDAIVSTSRQHVTDLSPDFTYLQPAQPTTIAHQLSTYAWPLHRILERIEACHSSLAGSIAGAGGTAGSSWDTSRERLAGLLGLPRVATHTRDAMWQTDIYLEVLSTIAALATHLSQIGQDFEIWCSPGFGLYELADTHSRESMLMPQKKNPYALVVLRTHGGTATGALTSALATLHTGAARTDHFQLLNGLVPTSLLESIATCRLAGAVFANLQVNVDAHERMAHGTFLGAADLADELSRSTELDYRTAHQLVGAAVRAVIDDPRGERAVTATLITDLARERWGVDIDVADELVAGALDPRHCITQRPQRGSCASGELQSMLDELQSHAATGRTWQDDVRSRERDAATSLREQARRVAAAEQALPQGQ